MSLQAFLDNQYKLFNDHASDVVTMCVNAGDGLSVGKGSMNPTCQLIPNPISGAPFPFTSSQWAEFEHHILIFKYMMAGVNIPNEILDPIHKSGATMNGIASHHAANRQPLALPFPAGQLVTMPVPIFNWGTCSVGQLCTASLSFHKCVYMHSVSNNVPVLVLVLQLALVVRSTQVWPTTTTTRTQSQAAAGEPMGRSGGAHAI
jgi:hypothetical protein